MVFFKKYSDIKNFLYRFTILKIRNFHIRIHKIVSEDKSTLLHSHPFDYISIIIYGGYKESYFCNKDRIIKQKNNKMFSYIRRNHDIFHRIESLNKDKSISIFITWNKYQWKALNLEENNQKLNIHNRIIRGKKIYCKKEKGIWFIGNEKLCTALNEKRHSIHQQLDYIR